MVEVVIKKVQLDDINQLQKIGRQTFYATFSDKNTEENMSAYLRDGFSLEKISAELLNDESDFYFAIYQNDVVGYLKINWGKTQTVPQNKSAVEIERIYVLPEFQGKDVGKQLYNKALEIAQQFGKKTREQLVFIKKTALLNLINIFLNWGTTNKPIL